MLKILEREYRKTETFRKDKVSEIKKKIKQGLYRVPGKLIVDKWFPE
ncbi:MAG: flagellar biosynthesis anti-sigma factor FlgM [Candidatus Firestonebacteria bacterium]|nr:flagellar biosynthesis anti-sigma factor FlgM [Candidatus Firestonebacteria bacterium]